MLKELFSFCSVVVFFCRLLVAVCVFSIVQKFVQNFWNVFCNSNLLLHLDSWPETRFATPFFHGHSNFSLLSGRNAYYYYDCLVSCHKHGLCLHSRLIWLTCSIARMVPITGLATSWTTSPRSMFCFLWCRKVLRNSLSTFPWRCVITQWVLVI